jgi:glycosyltransferase involved in cell wall biosynthesis
MRLLAINQFYAPDHAATSQLLADLCEGLVGCGDEVTVIASRGGYLGGRHLGDRDVVRGVRVRRPWATGFGKGKIIHRVADYGTFWASAVVDALRVERHDVVLALTTPPLIATGAALACHARRVPLVSWVQDVYPEVAARFGVVDEASVAYKALHAATRVTHVGSSRIVALSERMRERLIEQGAPTSKLRVIQNWADGSQVRPVPRSENRFRREHGLGDRFVALYSGNLGVGHEFETFMAAARSVERRCPEILFLFVGEGARKAEAERLASGLGNVRFLPYQPREGLAESLSAADVHLISLREGLDGLLVPSKLYGAMASARPVYFVGPAGCEVARVVREYGIGWAGSPGDAEGLAGALCGALTRGDETARLGGQARRVFDECFEKKRAVERFREVLAEAAGS